MESHNVRDRGRRVGFGGKGEGRRFGRERGWGIGIEDLDEEVTMFDSDHCFLLKLRGKGKREVSMKKKYKEKPPFRFSLSFIFVRKHFKQSEHDINNYQLQEQISILEI